MKRGCNFAVMMLIMSSVFGQSIYYLEPVQVTASRLKTGLAPRMRLVRTLEKEEIAALPCQNLNDLLKQIGGVDIQQRGPGGVQADFSLRGASFEQVIILVDGVRVNDSQTGHHNSDIPLSLLDIERVEVLSGHGSSIYGSSGFGGIIHIITRTPQKTNTRLALHAGRFGTWGGALSQSWQAGPFSTRLSLEKRQSDGFREGSRYDIQQLSWRAQYHLGKTHVQSSLGYGLKDFGAHGFYGDYPSAEKTNVFSARFRVASQPAKHLFWETRFIARHHTDDFILYDNDPEAYRNRHSTWRALWDGQINWQFSSRGEMAWGFELSREEWEQEGVRNASEWQPVADASQNLYTLWMETVWSLHERMSWHGGVRWDHTPSWGHEFNPSMSLLWTASPNVDLSLSLGRVFRAPSFTELYYNSPANVGDAELKPEGGWSYEGSIRCKAGPIQGQGTLFSRWEKNRIDWVRWHASDPWQVINIGSMHIYGATLRILAPVLQGFSVRMDYTHMTRGSQKKVDYQSKYLFNILEEHLMLSGDIHWFGGVRQSVSLAVKKREHQQEIFLVDTRLMYPMGSFEFYLDITNILNEKYQEIPGVDMPGWQLTTGCVFKL